MGRLKELSSRRSVDSSDVTQNGDGDAVTDNDDSVDADANCGANLQIHDVA